MEPDYDNHVCLRCGRTIVGLDNYVTHRQQKCIKITQAADSPFLSDSSDILTSVDSSVKELEPSFSTSDIYKLSADDFFLSLNLTNIANTSSGNQRTLNSVTESFCSKLNFPSLENDLESAFSEDKAFLPESIIDESTSISIDGLIISNQNHECQTNNFPVGVDLSCDDVNTLCRKAVNNVSLVSSSKLVSKKNNNFKVPLKKLHQNSTLQKQRTSLRQANNKNVNASCCELTKKQFMCPCCEFKCAFSSVFLNHLLACSTRYSDANRWSTETFEHELEFARNSHFHCKLCSFYCNDNIAFLDHLKDRVHCQKAAELKNPLICLPCDVEYSGSDDMKRHFSKRHFLSRDILHPVIVNERKRKLHCCYCLEIMKRCNHLLLERDCSLSLHSDDVKFFTTSMKVVSQCCYGIKRHLLNSYLKLFHSISKTTNSEFVSSDISVSTSVEKSHKIISRVNVSSDKLKLLKSSVKKLMGSSELKKKYVMNRTVRRNANRHFCFLCKTQLPNEASFQKHLKSHSNDVQFTGNKKTYLCEICGYVSKTFHQLTKHRRYHTGEKPFKCNDCDISFAVCSQLLRHTRLHTGAKPYKCPYCSYICNTQENLRKHILKTKKHAGKKMYPCKYCDFECNDFSEYKAHLLKEHSENFPDNKSVNSSAVAGLYDTLKT